ncbi:MAG: hypothetical protein KGN97_00640 [Bacteroidota bacterium]|jgi:hypothetical protein|nr:hypothetical protein [Bacteroidota bacterium]
MKSTHLLLLPLLLLTFIAASAKTKKGTFYVSWGYNTEWYTKSTITVDQSKVGTYYQLLNVSGHDNKGWDDHLFSKELTIPQYNYRIGYIFNEAKGYGVEINFDHTKFIVQDPQLVHVRGIRNGVPIDQQINFTDTGGFFYYLNNGANFLLFNFVKHFHLKQNKSGTLKLDALAKVGIGPLVPHVENKLFGEANVPHFQVGGWNIGTEGTIKLIYLDKIYFELATKLDYARYSGLKINHGGEIKQAFGSFQFIGSIGFQIPKFKK